MYYPPYSRHKLGSPWIGPYVVTKELKARTWVIQAGPDQPPKVVHEDNLKSVQGRLQCQDNWIRLKLRQENPLDQNDDDDPAYQSPLESDDDNQLASQVPAPQPTPPAETQPENQPQVEPVPEQPQAVPSTSQAPAPALQTADSPPDLPRDAPDAPPEKVTTQEPPEEAVPQPELSQPSRPESTSTEPPPEEPIPSQNPGSDVMSDSDAEYEDATDELPSSSGTPPTSDLPPPSTSPVEIPRRSHRTRHPPIRFPEDERKSVDDSQPTTAEETSGAPPTPASESPVSNPLPLMEEPPPPVRSWFHWFHHHFDPG